MNYPIMDATLKEFLQAIRPGLTFYGVLLTFTLFSFFIWRFFWKYEKELRNENIDRLKDLMVGFRHTHVEPFLKRKLIEARENAYEITINGLLTDLYPKDKMLLDDKCGCVSDEIKDLISESSLKDRLNYLKRADKVIEDFFSTSSGNDFLDQIDQQYYRKSSIFKQYYDACKACRHLANASLFLSIMLAIGILRISIKWPDMLFFFWFLISIQTFAYGIYSFIQLERYRRDLLQMWEELQLYGKI